MTNKLMRTAEKQRKSGTVNEGRSFKMELQAFHSGPLFMLVRKTMVFSQHESYLVVQWVALA